ncbi:MULTISPECIES: GntP family permease [Flavobacteriaceae]|uniref:GntP family permease n=1 Tax=Flavobacteriaceae TaxID=49546 RepID=UPI0014927192|nr:MULTISPECIES: SLC13 family permease [Allomuricauda]MDC6365918.1 SLC13 family permease [Muricauda sp. AC10]
MDPLIIILIGTVTVLFCIIRLKLHAAVSLLFAALVTALLTSPELIAAYAEHKGMGAEETQAMINMSLGKRLAAAFGSTSAKVGILIALASIIGTALMRSGGAERIIRALLGLFGKKGSSLALLSGSFTLAIPVFFDTVFYLMIPLVKSIGVRSPRKFGLYLMTVIAGGVMAHSLIPPTPGPLFVGEELGIDLGAMIVGGLVVGSITVCCGYLYALWANKRWDLPMRDTPDISIKDLQQFSDKKKTQLPSLGFSLLPVILPLLLITGNTFSTMWLKDTGTPSDFQLQVGKFFSTFGDANMALVISSILAMILLWSRLKDSDQFKKFIFEALSSAGMIILITSAGGAFGQMLQQTGIGIRVGELASNYQMAVLPLAFIITAVVRTAQGSATVAMVTAIGVMSGLAEANLSFHPVYLALAIGCGSKIFAWMNDSAFWIITKMSGMQEKETIKHFSFLLMVMGVSGLIAVMILSSLFPFV